MKNTLRKHNPAELFYIAHAKYMEYKLKDITFPKGLGLLVPIAVQELDDPQRGRVLLQREAMLFPGYLIPMGHLVRDTACHALFYYAVQATKMRNETKTTQFRIQYEDEPWPLARFHSLYKSIMSQYMVTHERMVKFWPHVDAQFEAEGLPTLSHEFRDPYGKDE